MQSKYTFRYDSQSHQQCSTFRWAPGNLLEAPPSKGNTQSAMMRRAKLARGCLAMLHRVPLMMQHSTSGHSGHTTR